LTRFQANLVTVPLFTGVIGYITNWTGVLMLFKPLDFRGVRVPGLKILFPLLPRRVQVLPAIRSDGRFGWQGIIPSRADKMASISVDKGLARLGSIGDFYRELDPDQIAEHVARTGRGEIRGVVERIMQRENPQLWRDLPPVVKEAVHARIQQQVPGLVQRITDEIGANIDQLIDVKLMVISYFELHPELLNDLFWKVGKKELRFMQNFGFYFGFPMGILVVLLLDALPSSWGYWLLPLCGVFIGWTVNYVGITMIFEPLYPKWYVPWRQGLFVKRQQEVTEVYAKMISDHVITLENIGNELLHGARSDRTLAMLESTLRPAVDSAVGPARAAVRVAMGTRQYDRIRDSVASEVGEFAPTALADVDFNQQQARKVFAFIRTQMSKMDPEGFSEMLRSAIKQDEWLLFLHGGVLGLGAGLLHLAIFGI
jgi:uncharacterized membrane protein YheB (UPF0754 family)